MQLFIFSFMVCDFGIPSKKCFPNPRLWRSPMLSSRNIMVLGLHVGQMTYSGLILGIWWKVRTDVQFSKQIFIQSSAIHWNDFPFWLGTFVKKIEKYICRCLDSILFHLPICLFFHHYQLLYRNYWNQVGQVLSTLLSHFQSFKILWLFLILSLLFKFYDQLINFYKIKPCQNFYWYHMECSSS